MSVLPIAMAMRAKVSPSDSIKCSMHPDDIIFQLDGGDIFPRTISRASSMESIEVTLDQDPPRLYSWNYTSVNLFLT
jgi:hypothetical protein